MSNPIKRAFNAARKAQKSIGGSQITISRGLKTSEVVIATVGTSSSVTYEDDGTTLYTKTRDYYIDAVDYIFSGDTESSRPARHDVITEVVDGLPLTFQVTAIAAEEPYVFHGEQRNVYRVHTKEI